jgi:16S rRNA (guanine527-N7)-methyltransferase
MPAGGTQRVLERLLREAQRVGALSARPVEDVIAHAAQFATALPDRVREVVDLGSGAGVPGLVVAVLRPDLRCTLVDRRASRTDALVRAVRALEVGDRVTVTCADVADLVRDPAWVGRFDAAMSRGLGPPVQTLRWSRALVGAGGAVLVSEPPAGTPDRWDPVQVRAFGLRGPDRIGGVAVFHVEHPAGGPATAS